MDRLHEIIRHLKEEDADVVLFVYREEYYKEREKPSDHDLEKMAVWQEEMDRLHGRAELILGKQRHGPIGTVELSFEGKFAVFVGGFPICVDGNVVGGIGMSGGNGQEDTEVGLAALQALADHYKDTSYKIEVAADIKK